jgi:acyl-coenzyme A synthetase/AMP-(fatty) acid ligase
MSELWNLWHHLAETNPGKGIIHEPGRGWTSVADIDASVEALLRSWASGPLGGKLVLMAVPNGSMWLAAFIALQKLDAIVAAADPSTPPHLLGTLAENLGASHLFSGGPLEKTLAKTIKRHGGACLAKITSGSTGTPKAQFFGANEMIADGHAVIDAMGIAPDDVNFALVPFGHSYGLGNLVMPLLMQGNASACASSPLPRFAVQDMIEAGVTICPAVPAFFNALNETELDDGLGNVRLAISAGSILPPSVAVSFEQRFGMRIHNFLGSSETGGIAYDRDGSAGLAGTAVGRPMPGVVLTQGKDGRLIVAGPAVVRHGNRRRLNGLPAFLTGDRGEIDKAGNLVLHGRATPLAKIGGRRVDPLEVERSIRAINGVSDAHVRVAPVAGNDRLLALVETDLEPGALRETLRSTLPEWKIPRRIVTRAHLPRDDRGKVRRRTVDELLDIVPNR